MNGIFFTLTTRLKSKHLRTNTIPSRNPLVTASSLTSRHCVESQRSLSYCRVGPALRYRSRKACSQNRRAVREETAPPGLRPPGATFLLLGKKTSQLPIRQNLRQKPSPSHQIPVRSSQGGHLREAPEWGHTPTWQGCMLRLVICHSGQHLHPTQVPGFESMVHS